MSALVQHIAFGHPLLIARQQFFGRWCMKRRFKEIPGGEAIVEDPEWPKFSMRRGGCLACSVQPTEGANHQEADKHHSFNGRGTINSSIDKLSKGHHDHANNSGDRETIQRFDQVLGQLLPTPNPFVWNSQRNV